jgi:sulfur relay (sulfurtransferase) DsrC/TusE family protein
MCLIFLTHDKGTHPINWAASDLTGTLAFPTLLHPRVQLTRAPMSLYPAMACRLWTRLYLSRAGACQTLWTCHHFNATSPFTIACKLNEKMHTNAGWSFIKFITEFWTMFSKLHSIGILVHLCQSHIRSYDELHSENIQSASPKSLTPSLLCARHLFSYMSKC